EEDGEHVIDSTDERSKAGRSGRKKKKRKSNNQARRSKGQVGDAKSAKQGAQLAGATAGAGVRGGPRSLKGSSTALVAAGAHTARDEEAPLASAEMSGLASLGPVF
ncbi:unnamed protein product, partial [Hapterophycus canaliculatus]